MTENTTAAAGTPPGDAEPDRRLRVTVIEVTTAKVLCIDFPAQVPRVGDTIRLDAPATHGGTGDRLVQVVDVVWDARKGPHGETASDVIVYVRPRYDPLQVAMLNVDPDLATGGAE